MDSMGQPSRVKATTDTRKEVRTCREKTMETLPSDNARSRRGTGGTQQGQSAASPRSALDELERLAHVLRQRRMREGFQRADRTWLELPLEQWCANLDNTIEREDEPALKDILSGTGARTSELACRLERSRTRLLTMQNRQALMVAMNQSMSVRDALILSLVGDLYGEQGKTIMSDFIANPHDAANVRLLYQTLSAAFNDDAIHPDFDRCAYGLSMLDPMTEMSFRRFCVQPCCVVAYGLWWVDDPSARVYATRALDQDGECVLAKVLLSAMDKGIRPAWAQARGSCR
jgi:hypothetical protein